MENDITDLGKVAITPQKDYKENAIYEWLDVVTYDGASYLCISENGCTGIVPTNTTYWQLLADKGRFTEEDKEIFKQAVVEDSKTEINEHTENKKTELESKKTTLENEMSDTKDILVQEIVNSQNDFDNNVIEKTNAFNDNATEKTNIFNQNVTNKTENFNQTVEEQINDYNDLATQKETELNTIAEAVTDMATSMNFVQFYVDNQMKVHVTSESELINNKFYIKNGKLGVKTYVNR